MTRAGMILSSALLLAGVACSAPSESGSDVAVRDSSGVELVDVRGSMLDRLPEWTVDSVALAIGALSGPPEYRLNYPGAPLRLRDGRIAVSNKQLEIRFFDSTGKFLKIVGRPGEKPGEYRQIWSLSHLGNDSVLVFDAANERVSVLDAQGNLGRSYPVTAKPIDIAWLADGSGVYMENSSLRFMDRYRTARDAREVLDSAAIVRLTTAGVPADTLARVPASWWGVGGGRFLPVIFSGGPILAAGARNLVVAHGDEFTLRWFDHDGRLTRRTRVNLRPEPVTKALKAEYERAQGEGQPPPQSDPARRYAAHVPLITQAVIDGLDDTWVSRWSRLSDSTTQWLIFDPDGKPVARIRLPAGLRPHDIDEDYIIGTMVLEDGRGAALRYRLRRLTK